MEQRYSLAGPTAKRYAGGGVAQVAVGADGGALGGAARVAVCEDGGASTPAIFTARSGMHILSLSLFPVAHESGWWRESASVEQRAQKLQHY
uniref:Uncharacterized protein n=1 Tax=Oryza rufipogon TaxID=4529 RepID=A0A0E0R3J0_ORYRU